MSIYVYSRTIYYIYNIKVGKKTKSGYLNFVLYNKFK